MTNNQNYFTTITKQYQNMSGRMLLNSPQKRGVVRRVRIQTPRKPNSARRQVVKLFLTNGLYTVSYIPGSNHTLKRYSWTLIRGKGARDLPGVYSSCIRGVLDLKGVAGKTRRRSVYGVPLRYSGL